MVVVVVVEEIVVVVVKEIVVFTIRTLLSAQTIAPVLLPLMTSLALEKPKRPLVWLAQRLLVKSGRCKAMLMRNDDIVRCDADWETAPDEPEENEEVTVAETETVPTESVSTMTTTPTPIASQKKAVLETTIVSNESVPETKTDAVPETTISSPKKKPRATRKAVLVNFVGSTHDLFCEAVVVGHGDRAWYRVPHRDDTVHKVQRLERVSDQTGRKLRENDKVFVRTAEIEGTGNMWRLAYVQKRFSRGLSDVKFLDGSVAKRVPRERLCWANDVGTDDDDSRTRENDAIGPWDDASTKKNEDAEPETTRVSHKRNERRVKKKRRKKKKKKTTTTDERSQTTAKPRVVTSVSESAVEQEKETPQSPRTVARLRLKVKRQRTAELLRKQRRAATTIQARVRGTQTRERLDRETREQTQAARLIQTNYRGHRDRVRAASKNPTLLCLNSAFRVMIFECMQDKIDEIVVTVGSSTTSRNLVNTHAALLDVVRQGHQRHFVDLIRTESEQHGVDGVVIAVHDSACPASTYLTARTRTFLHNTTRDVSSSHRGTRTFDVLFLDGAKKAELTSLAAAYACLWSGINTIRSVLYSDSDGAFLTLLRDDATRETLKILSVNIDQDTAKQLQDMESAASQAIRDAKWPDQPARGSIVTVGAASHMCSSLLSGAEARTERFMTAGRVESLLRSRMRAKGLSSAQARVCERQLAVLRAVTRSEEIVYVRVPSTTFSIDWATGWALRECEKHALATGDISSTYRVGTVVEHLRHVHVSSDAASTTRVLVVGDKIKARYGGKNKWFRGTVARVNKDGKTYDVVYDDGDQEQSVAREMIKLRKRKETSKPQRRTIWSTAIVQAVDQDTYALAYDDRSVPNASGVSRDALRLPLVPHARLARVGSETVVRCDGHSSTYREGRVERVHNNGTCDVVLDSGETLSRVPSRLLHILPPRRIRFEVGDDVEVHQRANEWWAARVTVVWRDGSYDVAYDTGETRSHVRGGLLRHLDMPKGQSGRVEIQKGDKVEVRAGGKTLWRAAVVESVASNGTIDVKYVDDDARETKVRRQLVRTVTAKKHDAAVVLQSTYRSSAARRHMREETRARRLGVTSATSMKTPEETSIATTSKIVRDSSTTDDVPTTSKIERLFRAGDRDGDGFWNFNECNRVQRCQREELFTVPVWNQACTDLGEDPAKGLSASSVAKLFQDQESELEHILRAVLDDDDTVHTTTPTFVKGQRVEAHFNGKTTRWFPGTIQDVASDGTYVVLYADGDRGTGVVEKHIRPFIAHKVGDVVDVKPESNPYNDYARATILKVHDGGTSYDVLFVSDGTSEENVESVYMRVPETNADDRGDDKTEAETPSEITSDVKSDVTTTAGDDRKTTTDEFAEGRRVECRYHGKKKWFVGVISRVIEAEDGTKTFDVLYLDNDRERGVKMEHVRPFVAFQAGQEIEARYRRKKKWFPGVVESVDLDMAKYVIKYKDGDVEKGVEHRYIRVPKVK